MKTNVSALPRELVFHIADHCDVKTTTNLSASCKDMHSMLEETAKRKASVYKKFLPSDEVYKEYGFKDPKGYYMRDNGEIYGENGEVFQQYEHVTPEDKEPFAQAVRSGDVQKAHYFLRLGVDPNSSCLGGARMLNLAVHSRSTDMIQLFVTYGAELDAIDYITGQLVWTDHPAWEDDNGWALLHHVAVRGDLEMFKLFIPYLSQSMRSASTTYDETPLHLAVEKGKYELALAFMSTGSDVNARGLDGYSPLDRALFSGYWDIGRMIIESWGTKLGIEDANGCTDIHTANIRRGNCSETPLSIAIEMKRLDIVKVLCEEAINDHPFMNDEDEDDEQVASIEQARELGEHAIADYLASIPKSGYENYVQLPNRV
ncbi:hypothetical protein PENANT_c004G00032 [Penicillium antarcticum]|uniref:F-box domain-containing protein n=1 Tax=Penicillium antarcticum TaxID=416450 RepID=A0A1V6QGF3_9EURO|nr:uncharacterized protein N7508_002409 [Penicillium antarcticum]KAJ5317901.1 hypothetical protein N7508_002409 [Penicillium antarcticum]OQD88288.1 hypothetical protein PENANT_c004G00032 [Penicillium antarcticum]